MKLEKLAKRHVVLLGIGHTNAHVLRMWGMKAYPDTDLTCLSNHAVATYSGMLPAVLAGQTTRAGMEVDLVRLCESVGARLLLDPVTGIDHQQRTVILDGHPPVPFDVLSIGIGSIPSTDGIADPDGGLLRIKPMQTFLARLEARCEAINIRARQPQAVVIGGGVAGVEIAFCLDQYLSRQSTEYGVTLVTRGASILAEAQEATRKRVLRALSDRGIELQTGLAVTSLEGQSLRGVRGDEQVSVEADLAIVATGAAAPPLLDKLALDLDAHGFLATQDTLQVTSGAPIFAVGDSGTIQSSRPEYSVPKAGVYAVRQGPILWKNLRRCLEGKSLISFQPQADFLRLINFGNGSAVGQYGKYALEGRWVFRLKDWIDSSFMKKHEPVLMEPTGDEEMQCHGCGCKLGAESLQQAIQSFVAADGTSQGIELEDVAEIGSPNSRMVATTDFFTSPVRDAYLAGRIAAIHSASDVLASGATARQALGNVVLQEGDSKTQQQFLGDFLAGATREFQALGCSIVGGHTIVGPRFEAGFTVIGENDQTRFRKSNLRPGDRLYLTKPIGIGVLLAAHMRSRCAASDYLEVIEHMLASGMPIVAAARTAGVRAATDVTGFGLAGHLIEMLDSSNCTARISLASVPVLAGASEAVKQGIESSLLPENLRVTQSMAFEAELFELAEFRLLFDPQTCGGFLMGIPASQEKTWLEQLRTIRDLPWMPRVIGEVTQRANETSKVLEVVR